MTDTPETPDTEVLTPEQVEALQAEPVDEEKAKLDAEVQELIKGNEARVTELRTMNRQLDPLVAIMQRIETIIDIVFPDARVYIDLEFNKRLRDMLDGALTESRMAVLRQNSLKPQPGQKPQQRGGISLPNRR